MRHHFPFNAYADRKHCFGAWAGHRLMCEMEHMQIPTGRLTWKHARTPRRHLLLLKSQIHSPCLWVAEGFLGPYIASGYKIKLWFWERRQTQVFLRPGATVTSWIQGARNGTSETRAGATSHPHCWQTGLGWESLQNGCEEGKLTIMKILWYRFSFQIPGGGEVLSFVFNCRTEHSLVTIVFWGDIFYS